jgi:hypothetical protein
VKPIGYLIGKTLSQDATESIESRLLKQQLTDFFEAITTEESIIRRFQDVLDVLVLQIRTEAIYDGYIASLLEAETQ